MGAGHVDRSLGSARMKAMVLAAGLGTRLRPLTFELPKPMVPVLDRPVMAHILDLLERHGYEDVIANLHYFPDTIRDYFGDRVAYREEPQLLGTAGHAPHPHGQHDFEILGSIRRLETIARGSAIRELRRLRRRYGQGRWRKRKGIATVRLRDGTVHTAEIHWYEAHGIGRHEMKIKFPLLD
jgi:hypothetical protein